MEALTIWEPWASCIAEALKDLENRTWPTRYRGLLLIHAGTRYHEEAASFILNRITDKEMRARILQGESAFPLRPGIVGMVNLCDCVTESESEWFVGDYGFVFNKASVLPFIEMPGQRGIFHVPAHVERQVLAEFERRRHAQVARAERVSLPILSPP